MSIAHVAIFLIWKKTKTRVKKNLSDTITPSHIVCIYNWMHVFAYFHTDMWSILKSKFRCTSKSWYITLPHLWSIVRRKQTLHIYIVCALVLYTAQKDDIFIIIIINHYAFLFRWVIIELNSLIYNNVKDIDITLSMCHLRNYIWFTNSNAIKIDE